MVETVALFVVIAIIITLINSNRTINRGQYNKECFCVYLYNYENDKGLIGGNHAQYMQPWSW